MILAIVIGDTDLAHSGSALSTKKIGQLAGILPSRRTLDLESGGKPCFDCGFAANFTKPDPKKKTCK
jgi:hypothetical protein